jgi:hypothetical protein
MRREVDVALRANLADMVGSAVHMSGGYVGDGGACARRRSSGPVAYADKSLDDFHQLRAAAKAGQIEVADLPISRVG